MKRFRIWLLGGMIFLGAAAWAGSNDGAGSSGGGDNASEDDGAAWFLGSDKTIRACFELAPGFGVSADEAKAEIENAFDTWHEYIERKFKYADIKLGITTRVAVAPKCAGGEDLNFHFGTQNEEIRLARAKYNNPTAFAFKRSYDSEAYWGQGFVWFAPPGSVFPKENFPDWTPAKASFALPWTLRAMLLHEIGHILGNSHVSGTIMSARISDEVRAGRAVDFTRIDQARELSVCWQCPYQWNGSLSIYGGMAAPGIDPNEATRQLEAENFRILTGLTPKSGVSARIRADGYHQGTVLEISDWLEPKHSFPIEFSDDPMSAINDTRVEDSAMIFKRMIFNGPDHPAWFMHEKVQGVVEYGSLTTATGERVIIILERNLPVPEPRLNSPILRNFRADFRLKMIYQGRIRPLFEGSWLFFR